MSYMHAELELARDRQQDLRALAEAHREGRRAQLHSRMVRRAERAERRQLSHRDLAVQLRARLNELESAG
ncbi:MAG TPA: hypothetical protein VMR00_04100 [Streptosporangiaceae bacterium]|jgi:hypothetical protein|nr:hypothetical protein [Streptosporangiaceae bacterium]